MATAGQPAFAIPDHPWTKATKDAAAVRIAMTVGCSGAAEGALYEVATEQALDTDEPRLTLHHRKGVLNADLTVGANVAGAQELLANKGISCNGMMLAGQGFVVSESEADHLQRHRHADDSIVRPYLNGGELLKYPRKRFVIDAFDMSEVKLRQGYPAVYQHLLETVKPERDTNRRSAFQTTGGGCLENLVEHFVPPYLERIDTSAQQRHPNIEFFSLLTR